MKVNGTWIVQAWEHGKVLGCLDLMISKGGIRLSEGRLIDIKPGREPDKEISALVEETGRRVKAELEEVIGEALVDLEGQGARRQETNLGDLLTDILRTETGSDLAVLNGGGIRTDIPKGPIQVKTVLDVLPFNNFPVVLRLSGKEIREVLEQGVSDLGGHGGQISAGIRTAPGLSAVGAPGRPGPGNPDQRSTPGSGQGVICWPPMISWPPEETDFPFLKRPFRMRLPVRTGNPNPDPGGSSCTIEGERFRNW